MKNNFKIGDKVYAIKNSVWGMQQMVITKDYEEAFQCKHPTMGFGAFLNDEIILASEMNTYKGKLLKELNKLEQKVTKLKKQLFGPE